MNHDRRAFLGLFSGLPLFGFLESSVTAAKPQSEEQMILRTSTGEEIATGNPYSADREVTIVAAFIRVPGSGLTVGNYFPSPFALRPGDSLNVCWKR